MRIVAVKDLATELGKLIGKEKGSYECLCLYLAPSFKALGT